jgi:hypothetical protein
MARYYIDARTREVTEDVSLLAPELYWEYLKGTMEGVIVENWYCGIDESTGSPMAISFSHATDLQFVGVARQEHFKRHKANVQYLMSYTVPPSWYDETIAEYLSDTTDEDEGDE